VLYHEVRVRGCCKLTLANQRRRILLTDFNLATVDTGPLITNTNDAYTTLRISLPLYGSNLESVPEIKIEQDYFQNTVFNGFAIVGGTWTFVNGLFAAIFESTLLLVLFGANSSTTNTCLSY
jgi:hypothetical protein